MGLGIVSLMNTAFRTIFLTLLSVLLTGGQLGGQQKAASANPLNPLSWLVGGVWSAEATALGPGMLRIETRYRTSENRAFLRFTTHFISNSGNFKNYDGNLFYDPNLEILKIWYTDAAGAVTDGTIKVTGDHTRFSFSGLDFDDNPAELMVDMVRQFVDQYLWTLSEKIGGGSKQIARLTYVRKQPSDESR
jgi:hypothetical protein